MGVTLTMVRVSVILVLAVLCIAAAAKKPSGSGGKPGKPEGTGGKPNKPNKPGNGNKPNKPGKPVTCDVATNFPCLFTGDQCVDGDDGPTCQKGDMTGMPEMPTCNTQCGESCACLLGRCVCGGEVSDEMDLSMGDM